MIQEELVNIVESSGQTLNSDKLVRDQLAIGLSLIGGGVHSCVDTGVADAYVVDHVNSDIITFDSYTGLDGFTIYFDPLNENTGASTINYAGLGIKSVTKRNGKPGVFLVDTQEMKAHFVPVTIGITSREWVEVVDPPLSGPVVTLGQHLLQEGSSVILTGENRESAPSGVPGDRRMGKKGREG